MLEPDSGSAAPVIGGEGPPTEQGGGPQEQADAIYSNYLIESGVLTADDTKHSLRVEIGLIDAIMAHYFFLHREKYAPASLRASHVFTDLYPNNWQGVPGWCSWCDELEDHPNHIKE